MTPADPQNPGTATILVVEDDTDTREFIVMLLNLAGYHTLEASSGAAALSTISGQSVQAITVDLRLPDMDGLEISRHLRANGHPDLPIILVTADRAPNLDHSAAEAGVTAVIEKPFPMEALLDQLTRLLPA
jgi:CheY-like chemotaxis protein